MFLLSGLQRKPSRQKNSSSYTQSKVPLISFFVPLSLVSFLIFPFARSSRTHCAHLHRRLFYYQEKIWRTAKMQRVFLYQFVLTVPMKVSAASSHHVWDSAIPF